MPVHHEPMIFALGLALDKVLNHCNCFQKHGYEEINIANVIPLKLVQSNL